MDAPIPMSYEKALAIAREIAEALGGEQARAIEVLSRYAARGRRTSSAQVTSAQHFVKAQEHLAAGLEEIAAREPAEEP